MNFYDRYIALCISVGKSPSAVALEIGLAKPTVNRWKNGGGITDATAAKIAEYFNVPISFVRDNVGQEIKKPADLSISRLKDTRYYELSPENQKLVDQMIEKLYKSQSID